MIACNTSLVALLMTDDNTVSQRIELVLLAEEGEQLNGSLIGALHCCFCGGSIRTGESRAARVFNTRRLTHFNTNMRVVRAAAAVPASMIPRQGLIDLPRVGVNESVDAYLTAISRRIPVIHKHHSGGLRTAYRVEHEALYGDFSACDIAGVFGEDLLNDFQCHVSITPLLMFMGF